MYKPDVALEAFEFERGTPGTACRETECKSTSGFGPKHSFSRFLRCDLKISCNPGRNHSEAPRASQNDDEQLVIEVA